MTTGPLTRSTEVIEGIMPSPPDRGGMPEAFNERLALERAQAGDLSAFEAVIRRYESRVYSFLARWLGDRAAADDVLQETVLRAYRHLGRFQTSRPFRPWLFGIAVNEARMYLRRNRRRFQHSADGLEETITSKLATITSRLRALTALEQGLAALSPQDRQLLLLRFAEGMTLKDIAAALGVPTFVIKMRLHRARRRFRLAVESVDPEAAQ